MNIARRGLLVVAAYALSAGYASAGVLMTFEGLQNQEQVQDYYNGGLGSFGSGPGPNFGVTFSSDALALIRSSPFPGDPSPPTVLLLGDLSNPFGAGYPLTMTMDVAGGFSQDLNFYDIAIGRTATVQIWSGLDGTGTMLSQLTLPLLPPNNEVFTGLVTMPFAGTAESVVFAGGNLQLVFDDISFGPAVSVPEPREALNAMVILSWLSLVHPRWRRKTRAA
jgi:hypothetical protein